MTMAPPISARCDGTSECTSQTQIGASTGSNVPISAAMGAGKSLAPVTKNAMPKPWFKAPKANSKPISAADTARLAASGSDTGASMRQPRQQARVMRTPAERRVTIIAIANISAISTASMSPTGETSPLSEPETITVTPSITAPIAAQVTGTTYSLKARRPISAAIRGVPAWIRRIFATVVCLSATMKAPEAVAKQMATARPGYPIVLKSRMLPLAPSRHSMNSMRNAAAQMERKETIAQLSSVARKRAIVPPKLQTIADADIRAMPVRSADKPSTGKEPAVPGGTLDMSDV